MTGRARCLRALRRLRAFRRNELGVTAVEYALVLAFFSILCIVAFTSLSNRGNTQYQSSTNTMTQIQESPLPAVSP